MWSPASQMTNRMPMPQGEIVRNIKGIFTRKFHIAGMLYSVADAPRLGDVFQIYRKSVMSTCYANLPRLVRTLSLGLIFLAAGPCAQAIQMGSTPEGIEYISGGVGESESQELRDEQGRFNLWLLTAAKRSGAYLFGVQVKITDIRSRNVVLEHAMDGPRLLVALPPGHYEIRASYRDNAAAPEQVVKMAATLAKGKQHRQMVLYFDSADAEDSKN